MTDDAGRNQEWVVEYVEWADWHEYVCMVPD